MRIAMIGGTGHIGTFLARMLVDDGCDVAIISSGRKPVKDTVVAEKAETAVMRYPDMLADGSFASMLREKRIDAVIDILQGDTERVYSQCRENGVEQLVMCGSLWMYGRPKVVPTPEITQGECPVEVYQTRYADMLRTIERSKKDGFCACAIMPPNVCGPGKIPLDGMGGRSREVHRAHRRGEKVFLPFPGTNLVGPCDAEDVARGFFCAVKNADAAAGEIFNVGSAYALTAERFIQAYADIHGTTIPIEYVSAERYINDILPELTANYHFMEHMCPDISKISSRLGYRPRFTPEETMERAVKWMIEEGLFS